MKRSFCKRHEKRYMQSSVNQKETDKKQMRSEGASATEFVNYWSRTSTMIYHVRLGERVKNKELPFHAIVAIFHEY